MPRVIVAKVGVSQKGDDGKMRECPVGSEIEVSPSAFEMLKQRGLIEDRESKPKAPPKTSVFGKRPAKEGTDG